jgi:hypothetical protein
MGVEQGGPSEEDMKIRPGESARRVQDIDEARSAASEIEFVDRVADHLYDRAEIQRKKALELHENGFALDATNKIDRSFSLSHEASDLKAENRRKKSE